MELGELLNGMRSAVTVVSFLVFIGIVAWAYSSRRGKAYEEAANLPFQHDEELPGELDPTRATQTKRNES
ncbi:MAG: cbb3-type cytochrome c oxidase subunit 3 [Rhodocyclaceae bacterium]|nr:cbb3-type cytochrome c oxidase subunit 3 [Rhodocyclaceae bacterium]